MSYTTINEQFYPTPPSLVARMWGKFDKDGFKYSADILDSSAGRGDLLAGFKKNRCYESTIEAVEIDFDNQAILREKDYTVVGHDFMDFVGAKHYSHIIMNPPFAHGAKHVCKAFDILRSGELVALVNAETIRNTCDKHRTRLAQIIEDTGAEVEFVSDEFLSPDTLRKTPVECAIIYIQKDADLSDLSFIDELTPDLRMDSEQIPAQDEAYSAIAIKQNTVAQAVLIFNAAVKALENASNIGAEFNRKYSYFANLLADSVLRPDTKDLDKYVAAPQSINFNEEYKHLKARAWSHCIFLPPVNTEFCVA